MLGEGKVTSFETHLEQFRLNDRIRQADLQNLLAEYSQLLDDYKALKEVHDGNHTNGITASGSSIYNRDQLASSSHVLVLVDGNDYIFNEELIRDKEEGGMKAARMLHGAVESYIAQSVLAAKHARIVVRIYADLTNLSKQLAKTKLTGLEKRSIASFSAGFTRAISMFDFVDALDEEGTKFKIREHFKIAVEDSSCSHILYAACHDSAYLSQLVPFCRMREKITLVQAAGWNPDFQQFDLPITQFPTVFRWSELPTIISVGKTVEHKQTIAHNAASPSKPSVSHASENFNGDHQQNHVNRPITRPVLKPNGLKEDKTSSMSNKSPEPARELCKYFPKGFCRNGSKCKFEHVPSTVDGTPKPRYKNSADRSSISAQLPPSAMVGFIPVNKENQRLDTYIQPPTNEEWKMYNARFHKQKPCNSFQLQRVCMTLGCPYDHNELEPESRHVLEYVLKCTPCPQRGDCRSADCYYGHICQKDGCTGQMKGCRMKPDLHNVDPEMKSVIAAEPFNLHQNSNGVPLDQDLINW